MLREAWADSGKGKGSVLLVKWFGGLCLAAFSMACLAVQEVRVGAYHFPPYVVAVGQASSSGLLPELLKELNRIQAKYRFVLVPTSSARRYRDFEEGRFDLIFFEAPNWGWQDTAFEMVDMYLEDTELFIARAEPGRDQGYFDNLRDKRLALLHGYHYAFADFNADPRFLAANYQAALTHLADNNLRLVLLGRADIALVTQSYLQDFLRRYPQHRDAFLVSERIDQVYRHRALLSPAASLPGSELQQLLLQTRTSGGQQQLFGPLGIRRVPLDD